MFLEMSSALNEHIRMIAKGSCDTEEGLKINCMRQYLCMDTGLNSVLLWSFPWSGAVSALVFCPTQEKKHNSRLWICSLLLGINKITGASQ